MRLWQIFDWIDSRIVGHRIYSLCRVVVFTWPKEDMDSGQPGQVE